MPNGQLPVSDNDVTWGGGWLSGRATRTNAAQPACFQRPMPLYRVFASTMDQLMFPYDPEILAAVQAPAQSIADVIRILQSIEDTCSDLDGLKWFNWLYLQVTQAVETRVSSGGLTDPAWLAELDVQFARLYFGAVASALSGQTAPDCWQVLFDSRAAAPIARI